MCRDAGVSARSRSRRDVLRLGGTLTLGGLATMLPARVAHAETVTAAGTVTRSFTGRSPFGLDQWAYVPFEVPSGSGGSP
jgi:hypothetical protein